MKKRPLNNGISSVEKYPGLAGTDVTMCDCVSVLASLLSTKLIRRYSPAGGRPTPYPALRTDGMRCDALSQVLHRLPLLRRRGDPPERHIDVRSHDVLGIHAEIGVDQRSQAA